MTFFVSSGSLFSQIMQGNVYREIYLKKFPSSQIKVFDI